MQPGDLIRVKVPAFEGAEIVKTHRAAIVISLDAYPYGGIQVLIDGKPKIVTRDDIMEILERAEDAEDI